MHVEKSHWTESGGWHHASPSGGATDLVLLFGGTEALESAETLNALFERYPGAQFVGCSTAGEVNDTRVTDGSIVATAIRFEHSKIRVVARRLASIDESSVTGEKLARSLDSSGLVHVFVLAGGLGVNGSALVTGMKRELPPSVAVTGGLAGDGNRFQRTCVLLDRERSGDLITAVGFYGDRIRIGFGSMGGWDTFGPERTITRSTGNVLYELDGEEALALYSRYLGEHSADLPASGLLFPLSVRTGDNSEPVVRTIVGMDRGAGSLTFVGEIPQGARARLMRANLDRLIDGAAGAAERCRQPLAADSSDLAILISCVGRRLVLKHRTEEELENVREVLGPRTAICGFYSYGEIAPFVSSARCELHNQTMTITTFSER